ncbi:MAG: hypothetical protein ABIK18_06270 [candidate division WOR-3 bacterium]
MTQGEIKFETLGSFSGRGSTLNALVGPAPEGKEWLYVSYAYVQGGMHIVAFDPDTGAFKIFENPEGGAWALEVGPDGKIYAGTFYNGHILRLDPKAEKLEDLGQAIPGESYIWTLSCGPDGKIYGGTYPGAKLLQFDPSTGKCTDLGRMDPVENYNRSTAAGSDGWVYCGIGTARANLVAFNPATRERRSLIPEDKRSIGTGSVMLGADGKVYGTCLGQNYLLENGRATPIEKLPSAKPRTVLKDGRPVSASPAYKGKELALFRVAAGPDGKIYASSVMPEYLLVFDPTTRELKNLGLIPGAEAYSMLAHQDKLYIASYTGATLQIYDPKKPFNPGSKKENNPAFYGSVAPYQDRPYDICLGSDGKIYLACVPSYGHHGGALAWFDPKTQEIGHIFAPVPDQAVSALCALPDGLLAVGTSIEGGPGTHPKAKEAVLFLWDTKSQRKVFECVPVPGAGSIAALTFGKDKLIYGVSGETMFIFDPAKRKILTSAIYRPGGGLARAGLQTLPDGTILALAGNSVLKPKFSNGKLEFVELCKFERHISCGFALLDGYVYFASGTDLVRFQLP